MITMMMVVGKEASQQQMNYTF